MKNKTIKGYIIEDPIYGFNLKFFAGDKNLVYDSLIKNKVPKSQAKDILNNAGVFMNSDDTCLDYQIIALQSKSIFDIIHEVEHHTFFVLNKVGIPINIETDEAFTYYSGMMIFKILNAIKNEKTK